MKQPFKASLDRASKGLKKLGLLLMLLAVFSGSSFGQSISKEAKQLIQSLEKVAELADQGKYDQAENKLERLKKDYPRNAAVYFMEGSIKAAQDEHISAVKAYSKAIRVNPMVPEFFTERAYSLYELFGYEEALTDTERALELNKDDGRAYLLRSRIFIQMGDVKAAKKNLELSQRSQKNDATYYLVLGMILDMEEDFAAAADAYKKHLSLSPGNPPMLAQTGYVLVKAGKVEEGLDSLFAADAMAPDNIAILGFMASSYMHAGRMEEALAINDKALKLDPKNFESIHARAYIYWEMGRYEEAEEWLRRCIEMNPGDKMIKNNLGYVYQLQEKWAESEAVYDEFLEPEFQFAYGYSNRGLARLKQGKLEDAVADFEQSIALNPNNSYVYYNRAQLYQAQGEMGKACADLNKALKMGFTPEYGNAAENLKAEICGQ